MSKSQGIGIAAIVAVILGIVGWSFAKSWTPPASRIALQTPAKASPVTMEPAANPPASSGTNGAAGGETSETGAPATTTEPPVPARPAEIVVQVAGAVHKPGVYHLKEGARNDDALKAA